MSSLPEEPIKILERFGNTKVKFNMDKIEKIFEAVGNRPFALYSINGKKRTGKSFILNYFACHLQFRGRKGWRLAQAVHHWFKWRGGARPETDGILIWPKPFIYKIDGREVAILLMDTQGNFDDQTSANQNASIFAVSTLLSSVLIFNVLGNLAEDMMQFLQLFTGYANLASSTSNKDGNTEDCFQKLVFLLRDMDYITDYKCGYYDSNVKPTGQSANYKTDNIDPNAKHSPEARETREKICKSFGSICAYLLPDPGKQLRNQDKTDDLDDDFRSHCIKFVELMLLPENIVTKKVFGNEVTGTEFKDWIKVFAGLFDNGLPELKSVHASSVDYHYIFAKSAAFSFYSSGLKQIVETSPNGIPDAELDNLNTQLLAAAMKVFDTKRGLIDAALQTQFKDEFAMDAPPIYEHVYQLNITNRKNKEERDIFNAKQAKLQSEIQAQTNTLNIMTNEFDRQARLLEQQKNAAATDVANLQQAQHNASNEITRIQNEIRQREQQLENERRNYEAQIAAVRAQLKYANCRIS